MKLFKYFLAILLLFTFSVSAQVTGYGTIVKVRDGDTVEVQTEKNKINELLSNNMVSEDTIDFDVNVFVIRLSNVNTEESVHQDDSKNTVFGKETSNIAKQKFSNDVVKYTCYEKGYHGRSICSVSSKEDGDYGEFLISNGYSNYETGFGKHPEYHWRYLKAEKTRQVKDMNLKEKAKGLFDKAKSFINN